MTVKSKLAVIIFVVLLLCGLYFLLQGDIITKQNPADSTDNMPRQNAVPEQQEGAKSEVSEQSTVSGTTTQERTTLELSPAPRQYGDGVANIADQSYSIKKENKDIRIAPGVSVQRGKNINVRIPGEEENIKIQRDSTYRSGEYKMLWEKKF